MPYNTSKAVVNRSKAYLDAMLAGRKTLTWPTDKPQKLAYRIREVLYAVRKHAEYEAYHDLPDFYRIRVRQGYVEAEYLGPELNATTPYIPTTMDIPQVEEVHGVVGACIKFGSKSDEIHFPNAILEDGERLALYRWGQGETPKWKLISHEDKGVTMTRRKVESVFLWEPEEGDD